MARLGWIVGAMWMAAVAWTLHGLHPVRVARLPALLRRNLQRVRPPTLSVEEMHKYDGNQSSTIVLGILGEAFDVSEGRKFYAPGNGYSCFAGKDASRAFITGEFEGSGLTDNVAGLKPEQLLSLDEWRQFYHQKYLYVGKVTGGFFFDERGEPTSGYHDLQEGIQEGKKIKELKKAAEDQFAPCSSKWTKETGSIVWCREGFPRRVTINKPRGDSYKRCACLSAEQLDGPYEPYPGCPESAQTCEIKKQGRSK